MYLSTLFLTEIENGVLQAITKCNEEFLKRFSIYQNNISNFFKLDSTGKVLYLNAYGDELMALWDVFKDFKDEISSENLVIIEVMNAIKEIRDGKRTEFESPVLFPL